MKTLEVSAKRWEQFCAAFQQLKGGTMISIEHLQPNGSRSMVARDVALVRIGLDTKNDACNTNLVIEAGLPGETPACHRVVEPIHLRLKNGDGSGRYHRLEITAENGVTTLIFHPGLNPDMLKGLEPATP